MSAEILPAALLKRKAVVYVRQSTQTQVQTNLESQRRQYDLVEVARRHGFVNIEVIDDDLGRSASGSAPSCFIIATDTRRDGPIVFGSSVLCIDGKAHQPFGQVLENSIALRWT